MRDEFEMIFCNSRNVNNNTKYRFYLWKIISHKFLLLQVALNLSNI